MDRASSLFLPPVVSRLVDELRREVDLLIRRVGHWGPPRWTARASRAAESSNGEPSAAGSSTQVSRAELVHTLVQRLADLAADAEGRSRRPVPRLDNDLALVDQVRVMVADLAGAPTEVISQAVSAVAQTRRWL